jgi:hypothetical protein
VFLEVVADSWDVSSDFHAVSEANSGDLSESRVRLLRGSSRDFDANASFKWRWVENWPVLEDIKASGQSYRL